MRAATILEGIGVRVSGGPGDVDGLAMQTVQMRRIETVAGDGQYVGLARSMEAELLTRQTRHLRRLWTRVRARRLFSVEDRGRHGRQTRRLRVVRNAQR